MNKKTMVEDYLAPIAVGGVITVPLFVFSFFSMGMGHGDYVFVRVAFSIPMIAILVQGGAIGLLSITLAIVQYPCLMILIKKRKMMLVSLFVVAHFVSLYFCFSGAIKSLS